MEKALRERVDAKKFRRILRNCARNGATFDEGQTPKKFVQIRRDFYPKISDDEILRKIL